MWVPKLGGQEKHVANAAALLRDRRTSQYWDPGGLMEKYTRVMALPEDAWDIYMVYGPTVRWDGRDPPKPDYWMHQLGSRARPRVKGPYLEPGVFAQKVGEVTGKD